ncbi:acyltransferase family protein [Bradyrhizobium lupini]
MIVQQARFSREITGIQYLRGVAAVLVVIAHSASIWELPEFSGSGSLASSLKYGWIGVDIFFVISGFIIAVVSLSSRSLLPKVGVREFAVKRIVRIVPFLWLAIILYASVRFVGRGAFELTPYLNAMLLWPLGEIRPNVVWTLRHEALFYFVFCVSFLLFKRPYLLAAWCLAPFAFSDAADGSLTRFLFNPVNIEFGFGLIAGLIYLRYDRFSRMPSVSLAFLLATVLALFVGAIFAGLSAVSPKNAVILGVCSLGVTSLAINMRPARSTIERGFELLGSASYSIYLMHNIAILACYGTMASYLKHFPAFIVVVAGVLVSISFGIGAHLFVERPLIRALASRLTSPRSSALASVS